MPVRENCRQWKCERIIDLFVYTGRLVVLVNYIASLLVILRGPSGQELMTPDIGAIERPTSNVTRSDLCFGGRDHRPIFCLPSLTKVSIGSYLSSGQAEPTWRVG